MGPRLLSSHCRALLRPSHSGNAAADGSGTQGEGSGRGVRARRTQRACRPGGLPRLRRRHLADHAAGSAGTDRHRWTSFPIEFRQEDLTRLSFPDRSFRYVFSWGVIIHIHDIEKALDELARIIEPGGKLALEVTNRKAWDQKIESLLRFLLRKPLVGRVRLPLGNGNWYEMHGEKIWVWQFDMRELQRQFEVRGFRLTHRVIGEFSEIQRRVEGPLRRMLLRLNNLCYRLKLPPGPAASNLLVFQKSGEH